MGRKTGLGREVDYEEEFEDWRDERQWYTHNFFFGFCVVWLALLVLLTLSFLGIGPDAPNRSGQAMMPFLFAFLGVVWVLGNLIKYRGRVGRALLAQLATIGSMIVLGVIIYLMIRFVALPVASVVMPALKEFVANLATLIIMPIVLVCVLFGLSGRDLFDIWALHQIFKDDDD